MATWRELLGDSLRSESESWEDIEASTLTDVQLDTVFDDGFGGVEGCEFTVWTGKRVYFPTMYDGAENVASVARHPDGKPTVHVGG